MTRLLIVMVLLTVWSVPAVRAQAESGADASEQAGLEPEIIIRQGKKRRIEEYRVGGQVVMIKVTPKKGPVYYLVDTDGDGNLDTRRTELSADVLIPQWKIFEWK